MTSEKVIHISRGSEAFYFDEAGKKITVPIRSNREYAITMKNGEFFNASITAFDAEKEANEDSILTLGIILVPGYMNVMTEANCTIRMGDIAKIEMVHARLVKDTRSYKKGCDPRPETESFTFAFDNAKFSTPYRFRAYAGEFVSVAIYNPDVEKGREVVYGHIEGVDDVDNVIMTRYTIDRGVRAIDTPYIFPAKNLLGIYRFRLEIEPYDPNAPRRAPRDKKPQTD